MHLLKHLLLVTFLAACFLGRPAAAQLTNLDTFPDGADAEAWAVNDSGQIVGGAITAEGVRHAFLQAPTAADGTPGAKVDLGTLPGDHESLATDLNDYGQVVGWSLQWVDEFTPVYRAFLWTPSTPNGMTTGTMTDLGNLGFPGAVAQGINGTGHVVGWSFTADFLIRAFYWTPAAANGTTGTIVDLGTLPGQTDSVAWSINDAGQVAGTSFSFETGATEAFLWTPEAGVGTQALGDTLGSLAGGVMTGLGTLAGGVGSEGYDINNFGQVVGWSFDENYATEGFLWTPVAANDPAGTLTGLGGIAGGDTSMALGINDGGQVVGKASVAGEVEHAFIWTPVLPNDTEGTMEDIGTLGGTNSEARAINDSGQLVGTSEIPPDEQQTVQTRPFTTYRLPAMRAFGFYEPLSSPLVPAGKPVTYGRFAHRRNSVIPLRMDVFQGDTQITGRNATSAPVIVGLRLNGQAFSLPEHLDAGSANGRSYAFRAVGTGWMYDLSTKPLPVGDYIITVRLPDGALTEAGFVVR